MEFGVDLLMLAIVKVTSVLLMMKRRTKVRALPSTNPGVTSWRRRRPVSTRRLSNLELQLVHAKKEE